jgi:hypothetical protein
MINCESFAMPRLKETPSKVGYEEQGWVLLLMRAYVQLSAHATLLAD